MCIYTCTESILLLSLAERLHAVLSTSSSIVAGSNAFLIYRKRRRSATEPHVLSVIASDRAKCRFHQEDSTRQRHSSRVSFNKFVLLGGRFRSRVIDPITVGIVGHFDRSNHRVISYHATYISHHHYVSIAMLTSSCT